MRESKKENLKISDTSRAIGVNVLAVIITISISILANYIYEGITTDFQGQNLGLYLTVFLFFTSILIVFTYGLRRVNQEPSKVEKLKHQLQDAYISALEKSAINPRRR